MNLIHSTNCPACLFSGIQEVLRVTDHTVTGERFVIWQCSNCGLRFTQDVPDAISIGKYYKSENYISHSNTSTGVVNRLYHLVRRYTIKSKRKFVERYSGLKRGNLLDIGAGAGVFAASMLGAGWNVTALEPDASARAVAAKSYGIIEREVNDLFKLQEYSFDVVTLWHVLEHIHPLHEYLRQVKKIIRKKGIVLIAVPNYTSFDANVYKEYWAAYDVPRHLYHFSPAAMKCLLEKQGFILIASHPMWFDSFYVSLLSEKYKNGKGNLLKGFVNGIVSNIKALSDKDKCSSLIYVAQVL